MSASEGSSRPLGWLWSITLPSFASRAATSTASKLPRATALGLCTVRCSSTSARKHTSLPPARAISVLSRSAASADSERGRTGAGRVPLPPTVRGISPFVLGLEPVQPEERPRRDAHGESLGNLRTQVLSFCFLAAGNRTLFRIRRYPGELGCRARSVCGSPIWCSASSGS